MAVSSKKEEKTRYLELNNDLKSGNYRPMYLLYGSEEYLKTSYKRMFRQAIGGEDGMNYQLFEGMPDVDSLIDALETMPFFAEHRLVLISGSGLFKKTPPERLLTYLPKMPGSSHLMFIENEVDKRNKLYKLVSTAGFACELGEQDEKQLAAWAARYLMKAGKKIRGSTMEQLLRKTGSSMDNILSELEKLIAYTGSREVIEDEDLEAICTENVEDRVFDMITELSLGNTERAMACYRDLLFLQEAPMKLLALMRRNFNQLLLAKECLQKGVSRQESAAYIGVSPWAAGKLLEQAKHYTRESLQSYIRRCLDYDTGIKSGNLSDRMAVELLLTS